MSAPVRPSTIPSAATATLYAELQAHREGHQCHPMCYRRAVIAAKIITSERADRLAARRKTVTG